MSQPTQPTLWPHPTINRQPSSSNNLSRLTKVEQRTISSKAFAPALVSQVWEWRKHSKDHRLIFRHLSRPQIIIRYLAWMIFYLFWPRYVYMSPSSHCGMPRLVHNSEHILTDTNNCRVQRSMRTIYQYWEFLLRSSRFIIYDYQHL